MIPAALEVVSVSVCGSDGSKQKMLSLSLDISLELAERLFVNAVLAECGGNLTRAAKRLGIHRRSLQRKLRKTPSAR